MKRKFHFDFRFGNSVRIGVIIATGEMRGEICDENSKSVDSVLVLGKGWLGNVPNRSHSHTRASSLFALHRMRKRRRTFV